MVTPEEWARSLGEDLKAKERVERDIAQTVAMQREITVEKMPLVWEELIVAFQACCVAYNEQVKPARTLALHRGGVYDFMIRPDARPEMINGKYDPHNHTIEIRSTVERETYLPIVVLEGTGRIELTTMSTKRAKTPTAIAQDTIRECLIAP